VQERISEPDYFGEVLVGQALLEDITTPLDKSNRYLIAVPTMRVPMELSGTASAYLAFRALLLEVCCENFCDEDSGSET
jgi:hypothetical protein